jgi:hypothetical protein
MLINKTIVAKLHREKFQRKPLKSTRLLNQLQERIRYARNSIRTQETHVL